MMKAPRSGQWRFAFGQIEAPSLSITFHNMRKSEAARALKTGLIWAIRGIFFAAAKFLIS